MNRRRRAQRTYRILLRLYPRSHRRAFGEQMTQAFGDHYRDAVQSGGGSATRFWLAVLADTARSLRIEHAAEFRARRRRTVARRRDRSPRPATPRRPRQTRVNRRLRYRHPAMRPVRVLLRGRHHQLVYRGRLAPLLVVPLLVATALGVGTATAHLAASALAGGLLAMAWLGYRLRLIRPVPAGPRGNGPAPPGGAAMREPRRPLPMSPAGSAARPRPEQDSPGQAAAVL